MQHFQTYTLSAVTFRMSMTSQFPVVIGVALPCMNELECVSMLQEKNMSDDVQDSWKWCGTGLPLSTYPDHMMDVLVPLGVALQQIIAVLVCGENWFRWRELGRTSWLVQQKLEQETVHLLWDYFQQRINSHLLLVHTRPTQPVGLFTSRFCKRYKIVFFIAVLNYITAI